MESAERIFYELWTEYNQLESDPALHLSLAIEEIDLIEMAMKEYAKQVILLKEISTENQ